MKKYIAIALEMILIMQILNMAYGDWIDYMDWKLDTDKKLSVCIYEPDDKVLEKHKVSLALSAIEGVKEWKQKLAEYSGGSNYDISIKYIERNEHHGKSHREFKCNVHITFWEDRRDNISDTVLGVAWHDGKIGGREMSVIEIFPLITQKMVVVQEGKHYSPMDIENLAIKKTIILSEEGIKSVVMHEFGHAIGLGHTCQELYGHRFQSVMISVFDPYTNPLKISDYDLASVYTRYGSDGWIDGGYEPKITRYGNPSEMFDINTKCT